MTQSAQPRSVVILIVCCYWRVTDVWKHKHRLINPGLSSTQPDSLAFLCAFGVNNSQMRTSSCMFESKWLKRVCTAAERRRRLPGIWILSFCSVSDTVSSRFKSHQHIQLPPYPPLSQIQELQGAAGCHDAKMPPFITTQHRGVFPLHADLTGTWHSTGMLRRGLGNFKFTFCCLQVPPGPMGTLGIKEHDRVHKHLT